MTTAWMPPNGRRVALYSLRDCLDSWQIMLFVNNVNALSVGALSDLREAAFPGYSRQTPKFSTTSIDANGVAWTDSAPLLWLRDSGAGTQWVYGWAAIDPTSGALITFAPFSNGPIKVAMPGDRVFIQRLRVQLGACHLYCNAYVWAGAVGLGLGLQAQIRFTDYQWSGSVGLGFKVASVQLGTGYHVGGTVGLGLAPYSHQQGAPYHLPGIVGLGLAPYSHQQGAPYTLPGVIGLGLGPHSPARALNQIYGHIGLGLTVKSGKWASALALAGQVGLGLAPASHQQGAPYVLRGAVGLGMLPDSQPQGDSYNPVGAVGLGLAPAAVFYVPLDYGPPYVGFGLGVFGSPHGEKYRFDGTIALGLGVSSPATGTVYRVFGAVGLGMAPASHQQGSTWYQTGVLGVGFAVAGEPHASVMRIDGALGVGLFPSGSPRPSTYPLAGKVALGLAPASHQQGSIRTIAGQIGAGMAPASVQHADNYKLSGVVGLGFVPSAAVAAQPGSDCASALSVSVGYSFTGPAAESAGNWWNFAPADFGTYHVTANVSAGMVNIQVYTGECAALWEIGNVGPGPGPLCVDFAPGPGRVTVVVYCSADCVLTLNIGSGPC